MNERQREIKELLKKHDIKQSEIARLLGMSRENLSQHLRKKQPDLNLDLYKKIIQLLPQESELNIEEQNKTDFLINLCLRILARDEVILEYICTLPGAPADITEINTRIASKEKELIANLKEVLPSVIK